MGRRSISIDEKINRQKEAVFAAKDKYNAELEKLNVLQKKKQEIQGKELLDAFVNSKRSLEEILAFMADKTEDED